MLINFQVKGNHGLVRMLRHFRVLWGSLPLNYCFFNLETSKCFKQQIQCWLAEPPRFWLHNIRTPPTLRHIVKGKLGLRNNINQTILNSCLFSYLARNDLRSQSIPFASSQCRAALIFCPFNFYRKKPFMQQNFPDYSSTHICCLFPFCARSRSERPAPVFLRGKN